MNCAGKILNKKLFIFCSLLFLFSYSLPALPTNYTYNYDFWEEQVASPDAYRVTAYILGTQLGIGHFVNPQGLHVHGNRILICDTGNNRIVIIEYDDETGEHNIVRIVNSVMIDGEESFFLAPHDVFISRAGMIYLADTENRRVLVMDENWDYIFSITRPEDDSIDDFVEFLPQKIVVDFANRIFAQILNVNKGLMEFDSRGEFSGYMGASLVTFNWIDYIWRFFSTQAQRDRQIQFIPTEYNNVSLDSDGFIYVTTDMGEAEPVRRLNAMGNDILIRNGHEEPIGDLIWGSAGGIHGPSAFIDVVAFENDSYACFDRIRGRVFMYDFQGNLLYAFGGLGNREGRFTMPTALDRMGEALYALDSRTAAITRFDLTRYGELINSALSEYRAGRYDSSAELWEEVLKMNGNYDLAYIGIGRAALRQGNYRKAMTYYQLKHFREGYSRAFQLYRKQWVEENLWKILMWLSIVIFTPLLVIKSIKTIKEIREA